MQTASTPTAIYVRLSQDRTGAGLGVGRQEKECRELVDGMPGFEVRRVYIDNDVSASTGKSRPQYEAMLEAIHTGEVEAVAAWHTDRLHRSPLELEAYIEAGAPTYTVTAGPIDLATAAGRMAARTFGAVAKYEVEQKSERQKSKNRQVAASGAMPAGGPIPFGYEPDRMAVHAVRGRLIRDAYRALLAGESLGSVIRKWNASEHTAPRGGLWSYSTVRGVLQRPLNAGLVFYDGAVLPEIRGVWEPLVTEEDYYALRTLLGSPSRRTTTGRAKRHLLAGVVECQNCLRPMKSGSVSSRGRKYALYRCANPACPGRLAVAREALNDLVVERFLTERGHLRVLKRAQPDSGAARSDVEARIQGVTGRLGEDGVDEPALLARLTAMKAERRALADERGWIMLTAETVSDGWHRAETIDERQEILRHHLARLSVAPRGKTSHRFDPGRVMLEWVYYPEGGHYPDGAALVPANPAEGEIGTIGDRMYLIVGSRKARTEREQRAHARPDST